MATATCNSCGAPVRWVTMESGKSMPLDANPHYEGNIAVCRHTGRGVVLAGDDLRTCQVGGTLLYVSHFATCPQAAQHRKGKS